MPTSNETVRIAAVADLHCTKSSQGILRELFSAVAAHADLLLLCGDLTDYGLLEEAHVLVKELTAVGKVPMVAVLGNHDFESGNEDAIRQIVADAGVTVLDGDACEVCGIGIAGVKGFGGGFGHRVLEPWGEKTVKQFVQEAVSEAVKLESALARLRTPQRLALLHYAPIRDTVEGEPLEILPFLGCGRLEEPLNRQRVSAAFHGHAHRGHPEGRTVGNVPVYNVALPLLRRTFPDRPPFRVIELPVGDQSQG